MCYSPLLTGMNRDAQSTPPLNQPHQPLRALVLSGGGAKGAYEAGLIAGLIEEQGEHFDIICGTSIGAINAAFIAQDDTQGLQSLWKGIAARRIVTPYPKIARLQRLFTRFLPVATTHGLRRLIAWIGGFFDVLTALHDIHPIGDLLALTGVLDPTATQSLLREHLDLQKVKRVLITTATDLTTASPDVFAHFPAPYTALRAKFLHEEPATIAYTPETYAETIRASGAIPAAFSPVELATGNLSAAYVDGGVVNNTPIGQAIDAGATDVTVIYLDPPAEQKSRRPDARNIAEILLSCFGIMQQRLLELDVAMALRVNDAVGAAAHDTQGLRLVRVRTFRPAQPLAVGVLDFDKQELIDAAFEAGRTDARDPTRRAAYAS